MSLANTSDKTLELYINNSVDKISTNDNLTSWQTIFEVPIPLEDINYKLSVQSASIANTFPQFHSTERKVKINSSVITIPRSRVFNNTSDFLVWLSSQFDNVSLDVNMSVDIDTKTVTIENNHSDNITIDLSPTYLPFWRKMGYTGYETSKVIEPLQTLQLQYVPSLIPTQRVFITCDSIVNNSNTPTIDNRPILCCINITGGFGTYSYEVLPYVYEHDFIKIRTINSLRFQVFDDKYRPLEMRGGAVLMSLILRGVVTP